MSISGFAYQKLTFTLKKEAKTSNHCQAQFDVVLPYFFPQQKLFQTAGRNNFRQKTFLFCLAQIFLYRTKLIFYRLNTSSARLNDKKSFLPYPLLCWTFFFRVIILVRAGNCKALMQLTKQPKGYKFKFHRRALFLEWLTVVWNVVEALIAITAGIIAASATLITFGTDNLIELLSGAALI